MAQPQTYRLILTARMRACMHAHMVIAKHAPDMLPPIRSASLRSSNKEPLQVRIPSKTKRAFKTYAAMQGMEPNELFVKVWEHYERTKPCVGIEEN